ncbi:hypothetical protein CSUB01_09270 [Colletotrichum sublineola]|uniref:Uncharacterized protein n=1 Tax=Colletotrichum sublineola TaxID=1173701 RepID=A0A066XNC0_COLSU|nr:hypothetical protein CSUB01_09270 [Colletotrichum sublineola]
MSGSDKKQNYMVHSYGLGIILFGSGKHPFNCSDGLFPKNAVEDSDSVAVEVMRREIAAIIIEAPVKVPEWLMGCPAIGSSDISIGSGFGRAEGEGKPPPLVVDSNTKLLAAAELSGSALWAPPFLASASAPSPAGNDGGALVVVQGPAASSGRGPGAPGLMHNATCCRGPVALGMAPQRISLPGSFPGGIGRGGVRYYCEHQHSVAKAARGVLCSWIAGCALVLLPVEFGSLFEAQSLASRVKKDETGL